jgi:hypothetical protein
MTLIARVAFNRPTNNHGLAFRLAEPPIKTSSLISSWRYSMAQKSKKRRAWTVTEVRGLKAMAKTKTPATRIAKKLKRTEGRLGKKRSVLGFR